MSDDGLIDDARMQIRANLDAILYALKGDVDKTVRILEAEALNLLFQRRDKPPSEEFANAVCSTSTLVLTCEYCNRTYFSNHGSYDPGELEELRANATSDPHNYIESDYDYIDFGYMDGKQFVWGCACNGVRGFEDWLWSHRYVVERFFKRKAERIQRDAESDAHIAESVTKSVEAV